MDCEIDLFQLLKERRAEGRLTGRKSFWRRAMEVLAAGDCELVARQATAQGRRLVLQFCERGTGRN